MGWNEINLQKKIEILDGTEGYYYFAHSFYAIPKEKDIVYATCNYGVDFPAVIIKENIIATQFHPEKSGASGLKFIENFVNFVKEIEIKKIKKIKKITSKITSKVFE